MVIRPWGLTNNHELTVNVWKLSAKQVLVPPKRALHKIWIYLSDIGEIVAVVGLDLRSDSDLAPDVIHDCDEEPFRPMEAARLDDINLAEAWVQRATPLELRRRYSRPGDAAYAALLQAIQTLTRLGAKFQSRG